MALPEIIKDINDQVSAVDPNGDTMVGTLYIRNNSNQIFLGTSNVAQIIFRNDSQNFYILTTDVGGNSWNGFRPLTINLATGLCNINGNAATATALQTARTIQIGAQSLSFNGSANLAFTPYGMNLAHAHYNIGTDMNDAAEYGCGLGMIQLTTNTGSSIVNPNNQTGWHHYINMTWADCKNNNGAINNNWVTQIANACGSTDLWVRSRNGGEISDSAAWVAPWVKILTTGNYNSYAPTLTGGGASGTWGISITGNAENSKNTGHASYTTTASTSYILVRIKSAQTHWMTAFTLRVYQGYNHYDVTFSGYQYGANYWYSPQATLSSSTITSVTCYFGYVSANEMWVAIPGGNYTGAKVINVVNGYHPFTDIANAFTIENVSSLPGTNQATITASRPWIRGEAVTGAVWNDYAECREANTIDPGYVLVETGNDTLTKSIERLSPFAGVSSDTWGFSQGETDKAKTPIAVAGRVLVYPWQDRNNYKPGDCVCAAPDGKVDIMTREEVIQYPDRIVGTVSSVPTYDKWGGGENADRDPVDVNGRIWIKVR